MDPEATREGDTVMSVADNTLKTMGDEREVPRTCSLYVPLNSTCITAGQLRSLGTTLVVPAPGTVSDLRLMIEGKITEGGCDPRNIQVLLPRSMEDVSISLRDHEGVFLTVTPDSDTECHDDSELPSNPLPLDPIKDTTGELQAIRLERDALLHKKWKQVKLGQKKFGE